MKTPEVRRGGGLPFGQVVSQWVCDPRYTTNLRTLYAILVTYADVGARDTGRGKPYRSELAAQLGCSKKTLDRTVEEGETAGLFWVERRKADGNPNLNDANVYHLRDADFWRGEWVDPLPSGVSAKDVLEAGKKALSVAPKAAKKRTAKSSKKGVASPVSLPKDGGGGVTGVPRGGVTGVPRVASPVTPYVYSPVENPSPEPAASSRPSVPEGAARASEDSTDGRTDGGDVDQELEAGAAPEPGAERRTERTPGVELLLHIGVQHPGFAIYGKTLADQGRMVTGMLSEGWTRAQVREVVTGQPLPEKITTSVGAVIAGRLRAAALTGPPMGPPAPEGPATPTPPAFGEHLSHARPDCPGTGPDGESCRAAVPSGYEMCWDCLDMPVCACGGRRYDPTAGPFCGVCVEHGVPLRQALTLPHQTPAAPEPEPAPEPAPAPEPELELEPEAPACGCGAAATPGEADGLCGYCRYRAAKSASWSQDALAGKA